MSRARNLAGLGSAVTNPQNPVNIKVGYVTAIAYYGDGSELTGTPGGLGTALAQDLNSPLNKIYYTNQNLSIGATITVDPPTSAKVAYTQYSNIVLTNDADLIVSDGDDFIPDILGIGTQVDSPGTLSGTNSKLRVDNITNKGGFNSPAFPYGLNVGSGTTIKSPTTNTLAFDTNNTERLRITSAGITSVTGSLSVNGNYYPTTGPLSNRNLIINGAMVLAQRGTTSTDVGYQTVDRWNTTISTANGTQTQSAITSGAPYDEGFRYSYRLTMTSTSTNTSAYCQMQTKLEAQDIAGSGWKYKDPNHSLTCSFWVKSSVAGTYNAQYRADDVGNFFFNRAFTVVANTWTKVTHTIPGNASLVFNNDNGIGLGLVIIPYYGTDYTASSVSNDTWFTLSSNNYFPDYAQNFMNTSSATFDITGVQLEVGEKATPFEHRTYGDELAKCQRYYQSINNASSDYPTFGANPTLISGGTATGTDTASFGAYIVTVVPLRILPTVSFSELKLYETKNASTQITVTGASWAKGGLRLTAAGAFANSGRPASFKTDGASSYISFDAEL
jgi:hypothetical protein